MVKPKGRVLMPKILIVLFTLILSMQQAMAVNIDALIDEKLSPITNAIANLIFCPLPGTDIPVIIFWILFAGFFFTIYFRGLSVWGFKHAIETVISHDKDHEDNHGHKEGNTGEVSSLQALATALSGTIGIGSIAGVAISISIGGPGAAFWIFAGALLGMAIKFVEATAAVKYRRFNLDGSVSGGPMHYIAHGLTRKKLRPLGQTLSVIFATLCVGGAITGGNMIQINQSAHQLVLITGGEQSFLHGCTWAIGLVVAVLVGASVFGGIKSIARVTSILVPSMCFLYIGASLVVILANFVHIPHAIWVIVKQAFAPEAVAGGVFGTIIIGLRRSVQTNEAGTGAAAIAYAAVKTKEPVSQGFVSILETFLTGILCLLTSFSIVFSGSYLEPHEGISGIEMASSAFESVIPFFPIILSVVVILFALSTLISWAYYGQKAWNFLLGEGKKRNITFNIIYCLFIIAGSAMNVKSIIDITDAMMIAMSIPNIIALYILAPEIKHDLLDYCKRFNVGTLIYRDKLAKMEPAPVAVKVEEEETVCPISK